MKYNTDELISELVNILGSEKAGDTKKIKDALGQTCDFGDFVETVRGFTGTNTLSINAENQLKNTVGSKPKKKVEITPV